MYVVPVEKKSKAQNKFQFKLGDETFSAPRFDLLPASFVEDLVELDEKRVTKALRLALAGDDEALSVKLGELPIGVIADLLKAWQAESSVTLGE